MEKRLNSVLAGRLPVVIDRTGADFEGLVKQKNMLEDLGYETKLILINTPIEIASKRNVERERKLDPDFVKKSHVKVQENIDKFRSLFGNDFIIIDGSQPFSEIKSDLNVMYKRIGRWMEQPVKNPKAEEWRKKEIKEKDRRIKSGVEKIKNEIKRIN